MNKYLNISLIKHLLTWIYFGLWLVVVDMFWLLVDVGGWWWIYFGWWWMVVEILWLVVGGGEWWWIYFGWWWIMVGGGIV